MVIFKKKFYLPILSLEVERAKVKEFCLLMSRDTGKKWKVAVRANSRATAFTFNAPEDGDYWFQIQVVYRDGKKVPSGLKNFRPAIKVRVDTTRLPARSHVSPASGDLRSRKRFLQDLGQCKFLCEGFRAFQDHDYRGRR